MNRFLASIVSLALALLFTVQAPSRAQNSTSSLPVLDAVVSESHRLPVDGVRGLLIERGGDMLLLVTRNRGLSAPDSSYGAVLMRYSPTTGSLKSVRAERDGFESGLTSDGEFLWAGGGHVGGEGGIFQLDPRTGAILQKFDATGYHPAGLTWDGKHLWQADADARKLFRVDTEAGRVSRKVVTPGFYPTGLTHDGFHFWSADASTGRLYRHRGSQGRADGVVSSDAFLRPGEFVSLAWDGGGIWCVSASDSVAVRIELLR